MVDDERKMTDDGPWPYYKLTNESKGSGDLKKKWNFLISVRNEKLRIF